MNKIMISTGDVTLMGELNDSTTAREIWNLLPAEGAARTWGEEIYFEIPLDVGPSPDARALVEVGEIGYWPTGRALCLFFGPTPASTDDRPRAASPVNIVGRLLGDATQLRSVRDGDLVRVTQSTTEE
jgi:hypothetical protein